MVNQAASATASTAIRPAFVQLLRPLTVATTLLLCLLAVWLLGRRVAGQLQQPLSPPALLIVAGTLAVLSSSLRVSWLWLGLRPERWRGGGTLLWALPSGIALAVGVALSLPGTGAVGRILFWCTLGAVETAWYGVFGHRIRSPRRSARGVEPTSATVTRGVTAGLAVEETFELDEQQLPEEVCQQLTRMWAEGDNDTITGLLRARFAPHERSRSLHVAICPPMLRSPQVTVVQLSGPRARIKTADAEPFGVRFDLRLAAAPSEEQTMLLHFEANCGKPDSAGLGGLGGG